MAIDLKLVPHRAGLLAGTETTLDVLLTASARMQAPGAHQRLPLNLALVIDRSGSMSGRPLSEAKRCAAMIIDNLAPSDTASLVVYDDDVDILVPSRPIQDRHIFHAALRSIGSGGSTALHAGWLRGAEQAAQGGDGPAISRVLMLSDGQANIGLTDASEIAAQCAKMAAAGVSTSTYGLGERFNEDLMVAMARAGHGNPYYGRTAEDLIDPFRQEFDLMAALCARGLALEVTAAPGVSATILNDYPNDEQGRARLPDLAYGGAAWALIQLKVPRDFEAVGNVSSLIKVKLHYRETSGEQTARLDEAELVLPTYSASAFAALPIDELVARRAAELRAALLQQQARNAARHGDWATVEGLVAEIRAEAEHSPWLGAAVAELEKLMERREIDAFSKEAMYSSRRLQGRIASVSESRNWAEASELQQPSYLRRKREQGRRFPE